MTTAQRREDEVIQRIIDLLSEYFDNVVLVRNPDRITGVNLIFPDLTTDALIEIIHEGRETYLAADVMIVAASRLNLAYDDLYEYFDEFAKRNNLQIRLTAENAVGPTEVDLIIGLFVDQFSDQRTTGALEIREGVILVWKESESQLNLGFELVGMSHVPPPSIDVLSGSLIDQIAWENGQALQRKTKENGQAERTKRTGLPYILILDGVGTEEVRQGTSFPAAHPYSFKMGILKGLGENEHMVDAIFLLDRENVVSLLKGDLPDFIAIQRDIGV